MALFAIRQRHIQQHRDWMIRSYVVTFAFVLFRLMVEVMTALDLGALPERYATAAWLCWAIPLLVAEPVLQWRQISSRAGAAAGPSVVVPSRRG